MTGEFVVALTVLAAAVGAVGVGVLVLRLGLAPLRREMERLAEHVARLADQAELDADFAAEPDSAGMGGAAAATTVAGRRGRTL